MSEPFSKGFSSSSTEQPRYKRPPWRGTVADGSGRTFNCTCAKCQVFECDCPVCRDLDRRYQQSLQRKEKDMALVAKSSSGEYHKPPERLYNAACCDVIDLGVLKTNWGDKHKIKIVFQTDDVCPETKRPYIIGKKFTFSLHKNAQLRLFLEAWRGKRFTEEEVAVGYDLERLLNVNAQIQVLHQMGQDGLYAVIGGIMPPAKGAQPVKVAGYVRKQWATAQPQPQPAAKAGPKNDEEVPF